eukprot:4650270-Amphidinium_carterae.1
MSFGSHTCITLSNNHDKTPELIAYGATTWQKIDMELGASFVSSKTSGDSNEVTLLTLKQHII